MIPKFRAYDKQTDTVRGVLVIDWLNGVVDLDGGIIEREFDDVVLMQSTGLKDVNGVEIFEGDIVQGTQTLSNSIPHSFAGMVRYDESHARFNIADLEGAYDITALGETVYLLEIIGNIYENPELLEVAK